MPVGGHPWAGEILPALHISDQGPKRSSFIASPSQNQLSVGHAKLVGAQKMYSTTTPVASENEVIGV
jgi:hypothetical protein